MNEAFLKYWQTLSESVSKLSPQKKIGIAAISLILAFAIAAGFMGVKQDTFQVLYSDLQPEESRAVSKKLGELNIPYHATEDGNTISVASSQVATARMQLAKVGLPGQDVVGFEKFDGSTLGMSSYVQRIQYVRAIQGELTRSIQRLSSVKRARVHISVPPKKTFLEDEEPPKASVVLELRSGQTPSKQEITGIAHLVASAVEGLKVNQVSIVDTKGTFLHRPEDAQMPGLSNALLEYQRSIETEYEKRIEDILSPVVGLGKVRAKVTAEIDPSRVNSTEESYDPDKAVAKNLIKNDEVFTGSRPNPAGIPGSRSNLPGAEPQSGNSAVATNSTEKNMSNTSYAIPRKVMVVDKPSGNIKRLTVAVVVDGTYTKGEGEGKETFIPRNEEEIKRIKELVSNAVGFDESRRDSVTVNSMPFNGNSELSAALDNTQNPDDGPTVWWQKEEFLRQIIRNALIGGVILFFFLVVLRPFLKWILVPDEAATEVTTFPRTVAEIEAASKEEGLMALGKSPTAGLLGQAGEPIEKQEEEELKKRILERLGQSPQKGMRIVQDWLEAEVLPHPESEAA